MNTTEDCFPIPKLQGHHCFACGTDNPIGLNMYFYQQGECVCSDITLGQNHEGWENMAHGGIISTLVDEVMSWTVLFFKRTFLVTRKMEIKYVKPVPLHVPLTARGQILEEPGNSIIEVRGDILNTENKLLVRGHGQFVLLAEYQLSSVSAGTKAEMTAMFEQFDPDLLPPQNPKG